MGDEVEVLYANASGMVAYTDLLGESSGIDPDRPQYVRLYGRKNYRKVLRNFTRHSTSMISNDTQSSSEYSISQSY